ncbi:hypothetical protein ACFQV8_00630 [Pseudonocardia benzenivorans]
MHVPGPTAVCNFSAEKALATDNEQDPRKRAFTRSELQRFSDRADDEVDRIRSRAGRTGYWRSETRCCSRSLTAGGCGATRSGTCP